MSKMIEPWSPWK